MSSLNYIIINLLSILIPCIPGALTSEAIFQFELPWTQVSGSRAAPRQLPRTVWGSPGITISIYRLKSADTISGLHFQVKNSGDWDPCSTASDTNNTMWTLWTPACPLAPCSSFVEGTMGSFSFLWRTVFPRLGIKLRPWCSHKTSPGPGFTTWACSMLSYLFLTARDKMRWFWIRWVGLDIVYFIRHCYVGI